MSMKCPVFLQTKEGVETWKAISTQYSHSKQNDLLTWFNQYCMIESAKRESALIEFLKDHEMDFEDDATVQSQYKVLADQQALYSYFAKVKK